VGFVPGGPGRFKDLHPSSIGGSGGAAACAPSPAPALAGSSTATASGTGAAATAGLSSVVAESASEHETADISTAAAVNTAANNVLLVKLVPLDGCQPSMNIGLYAVRSMNAAHVAAVMDDVLRHCHMAGFVPVAIIGDGEGCNRGFNNLMGRRPDSASMESLRGCPDGVRVVMRNPYNGLPVFLIPDVEHGQKNVRGNLHHSAAVDDPYEHIRQLVERRGGAPLPSGQPLAQVPPATAAAAGPGAPAGSAGTLPAAAAATASGPAAAGAAGASGSAAARQEVRVRLTDLQRLRAVYEDMTTANRVAWSVAHPDTPLRPDTCWFCGPPGTGSNEATGGGPRHVTFARCRYCVSGVWQLIPGLMDFTPTRHKTHPAGRSMNEWLREERCEPIAGWTAPIMARPVWGPHLGPWPPSASQDVPAPSASAAPTAASTFGRGCWTLPPLPPAGSGGPAAAQPAAPLAPHPPSAITSSSALAAAAQPAERAVPRTIANAAGEIGHKRRREAVATLVGGVAVDMKYSKAMVVSLTANPKRAAADAAAAASGTQGEAPRPPLYIVAEPGETDFFYATVTWQHIVDLFNKTLEEGTTGRLPKLSRAAVLLLGADAQRAPYLHHVVCEPMVVALQTDARAAEMRGTYWLLSWFVRYMDAWHKHSRLTRPSSLPVNMMKQFVAELWRWRPALQGRGLRGEALNKATLALPTLQDVAATTWGLAGLLGAYIEPAITGFTPAESTARAEQQRRRDAAIMMADLDPAPDVAAASEGAGSAVIAPRWPTSQRALRVSALRINEVEAAFANARGFGGSGRNVNSAIRVVNAPVCLGAENIFSMVCGRMKVPARASYAPVAGQAAGVPADSGARGPGPLARHPLGDGFLLRHDRRKDRVILTRASTGECLGFLLVEQEQDEASVHSQHARLQALHEASCAAVREYLPAASPAAELETGTLPTAGPVSAADGNAEVHPTAVASDAAADLMLFLASFNVLAAATLP
jgi:hypothetical protein